MNRKWTCLSLVRSIVHLAQSRAPAIFFLEQEVTDMRRLSLLFGVALLTIANHVYAQCSNPGAFSLTSPANGATGIGTSPTLTWNASSGAGSYIVHIGTSNPPSSQNDQFVNGTSFSPANS